MKISFILILAIVLFACNSEKKNDKNVVYEYYSNGKIKKEWHKINEQANGPAILYYESGSIKAIGNFVNGKAQGQWVTYFDSIGKVKSIDNYTTGDRQGVYYAFYESGYLLCIGNRNADTLGGEFTYFYNHMDLTNMYIPRINSKGQVWKYISYDTSGEPHYIWNKRDTPSFIIHVPTDKITQD